MNLVKFNAKTFKLLAQVTSGFGIPVCMPTAIGSQSFFDGVIR